jgi:hypothetical protein
VWGIVCEKSHTLSYYLTWGEDYPTHRASPFLKFLAGLPAESGFASPSCNEPDD